MHFRQGENDGKITEKTTHFWGGNPKNSVLLESRWYTKAELQALGVISDAQLNDMFGGSTGAYYVSGNKLTWGGIIYTRK